MSLATTIKWRVSMLTPKAQPQAQPQGLAQALAWPWLYVEPEAGERLSCIS